MDFISEKDMVEAVEELIDFALYQSQKKSISSKSLSIAILVLRQHMSQISYGTVHSGHPSERGINHPNCEDVSSKQVCPVVCNLCLQTLNRSRGGHSESRSSSHVKIIRKRRRNTMYKQDFINEVRRLYPDSHDSTLFQPLHINKLHSFLVEGTKASASDLLSAILYDNTGSPDELKERANDIIAKEKLAEDYEKYRCYDDDRLQNIVCPLEWAKANDICTISDFCNFSAKATTCPKWCGKRECWREYNQQVGI